MVLLTGQIEIKSKRKKRRHSTLPVASNLHRYFFPLVCHFCNCTCVLKQKEILAHVVSYITEIL